MFGLKNRYAAQERSLELATRTDFAKVFSDDMSALHLLAVLLTADQAKAEECFVGGLEESIQGNPVFRQWARTWSKRVIIRNAIKMLAPAPGQTNPWSGRTPPQAFGSERDALFSVVWELPPFERFVFVISVLEGHSLSDSASLLGCNVTDVIRARSQALSSTARARSGDGVVADSRKNANIGFFARPELA